MKPHDVSKDPRFLEQLKGHEGSKRNKQGKHIAYRFAAFRAGGDSPHPARYVGAGLLMSAHEVAKMKDRELSTENRLTRIETKIDALTDRIDEALVTQIRDHGKRIGILERQQTWGLGWAAGPPVLARH